MTKKILIIDFETSDIDALSCEVYEFAYLRATVDKKIIECGSFLMQNNNNNLQFPDCNNIDFNLLQFGFLKEKAYAKICNLVQNSDYIIAHNGKKFDFVILNRIINYDTQNKIFIDTMTDLPIDKKLSLKLKYLALEYNIVMLDAHRAIYDVIGLFQLICKFDFIDIIKRACAKTITLIAEKTFEKNDLKKQLNFKFQPENKTWALVCKDFEVEEISKQCKLLGLDYSIVS